MARGSETIFGARAPLDLHNDAAAERPGRRIAAAPAASVTAVDARVHPAMASTVTRMPVASGATAAHPAMISTATPTQWPAAAVRSSRPPRRPLTAAERLKRAGAVATPGSGGRLEADTDADAGDGDSLSAGQVARAARGGRQLAAQAVTVRIGSEVAAGGIGPYRRALAELRQGGLDPVLAPEQVALVSRVPDVCGGPTTGGVVLPGEYRAVLPNFGGWVSVPPAGPRAWSAADDIATDTPLRSELGGPRFTPTGNPLADTNPYLNAYQSLPATRIQPVGIRADVRVVGVPDYGSIQGLSATIARPSVVARYEMPTQMPAGGVTTALRYASGQFHPSR